MTKRIFLRRGHTHLIDAAKLGLGELIFDVDQRTVFVGCGDGQKATLGQVVVGPVDRLLYAELPTEGGRQFIPIGVYLP
jgi:hypothetical protein